MILNLVLIVVCPVYQLPGKASQIYQQAAAHNVCIFTYSHLSVLVLFAQTKSERQARSVLGKIFKAVEAMTPVKDATAYWQSVNRTFLEFSEAIPPLWQTEKEASVEAITVAKDEALAYLAGERRKILLMSKEDAIRA